MAEPTWDDTVPLWDDTTEVKPAEPAKPLTLMDEARNLKNKVVETGKAVVAPYRSMAEPFASGTAQGITMGGVKPEAGEEDLTGIQKGALNAGKFFGAAVPIAATSAIGGATAAALGATKMAGQAAGGMLYGYESALAQNKKPSEVLEDTATQGVLFGAFSKAEDVAKYVKGLFGDASTVLSDWFYNSNPKIAEDLLKKGKPELGKQALDQGEGFRGWLSRRKVYNKAENEARRLNNSVMQQLENVTESEAMLPTGGGIDVADVKGIPVLNRFANQIGTTLGKDSFEYQAIKNLQSNNVLPSSEAKRTLKILDDIVGRDYLKEDISFATDAVSKVANTIRQRLAQKYPEIAADLAKEHLMIKIEQSLRPVVAGTKMPFGGSFSLPARGAVGSPAGLATATVFDNVSKIPNEAISAASGAGRVYSSQKAKEDKKTLLDRLVR